MTIRERLSGDVVVLDLEGNLSASDSQRVLRVTVEALVRDHRGRIILNMERVPYVDSTGLTDIVDAFQTARQSGGALKLVQLRPRVRELLAVTTLLKVLEVFDSEAEALASFGPTRSREHRIIIDGVKDQALAANIAQAIRAALSGVDLPGTWTIRLAPDPTNGEEWALTIDHARAHHKTTFASERDAMSGAAEQVVQAFPSLMAALNASTTIT